MKDVPELKPRKIKFKMIAGKRKYIIFGDHQLHEHKRQVDEVFALRHSNRLVLCFNF